LVGLGQRRNTIAVAAVLKVEMDKDGWYRCKPYTFDGEAKE